VIYPSHHHHTSASEINMPTASNYHGSIQLLAPTGGVTAGNFYRINGRLVFAMTSASAGEYFSGRLDGRVNDAPTHGATGKAAAAGAKAYFDAGNNRFTPSSTGMKDHDAVFAAPKAATATAADIILRGGYAA
jgi:hypothetical protein